MQSVIAVAAVPILDKRKQAKCYQVQQQEQAHASHIDSSASIYKQMCLPQSQNP